MDDYRQKRDNEIDMLKGNINRMCVTDDFDELWDMTSFAIRRILNLYEINKKRVDEKPSVTLDHRIGRWIPVEGVYGVIKGAYECSECGRTIFLDDGEEAYEDYPFCHCGAKMEVEE